MSRRFLIFSIARMLAMLLATSAGTRLRNPNGRSWSMPPTLLKFHARPPNDLAAAKHRPRQGVC
jgi:hypothetical protein